MAWLRIQVSTRVHIEEVKEYLNDQNIDFYIHTKEAQRRGGYVLMVREGDIYPASFILQECKDEFYFEM